VIKQRNQGGFLGKERPDRPNLFGLQWRETSWDATKGAELTKTKIEYFDTKVYEKAGLVVEAGFARAMGLLSRFLRKHCGGGAQASVLQTRARSGCSRYARSARARRPRTVPQQIYGLQRITRKLLRAR